MEPARPPTHRTHEEIAFLPAALEIIESPPNPIGRAILWCVIALVVVALGWASFGHVDVVAIAPGKLIPSDRIKLVQPLATGQVRAIYVRDGQRVKRGEVLIELDPTIAQADEDRLAQSLAEEQAAVGRQRAFAQWLETRQARSAPSDALQKTLLEQLIAEHRAKLASIDRALERKRADLQATERLVEKAERTLPLIVERADSVAKLAQSNLVPKHSALETEQARIEAQQELAVQRATALSLQAAIGELDAQRAETHAEAQRVTSQSIEEMERRIASLKQEVLKARTITHQQSLVAPIDGIVQQLKVHTIGGVVTPAEPLLILVPEGQPLEVEARVLNRDIGFIAEGQVATIKVDAFPFTRYGVLHGRLMDVSNDATADEQLGLVYATRVSLSQSQMRIDAKDILLSAGMAVTVEVKTGRRRLIEYFLSPLLQSADESVRER